ncbi:unnamed protein product [Dovyalis caffra]|uniref:F-box associated domain-containing protein n=1 Tax=Dovyalis caffra TaxID=77055 RepID=A0AAV1RWZ3_9ROSI|nr:unnamed protein product [Dovyalis caffra]
MESGGEQNHVEIYSLSTDSWRALGGVFINNLFASCFNADTNGMCSWWANNQVTGCSAVSFDMSTEVFFDTPVPDAFSDVFSDFSAIGVELLWLCDSTVMTPLGFWKNGGLFMETCEGQLVFYHPVTPELKNLQVDGAPKSLAVATYKEIQVMRRNKLI